MTSRNLLAANAREQAQWFMRRKGFGEVYPREVIPLQDVDCWYFYYDVADGEVELEVYYSAQLQPQIRVTTFTAASRQDPPALHVDVRRDRQEVPAGSLDARR